MSWIAYTSAMGFAVAAAISVDVHRYGRAALFALIVVIVVAQDIATALRSTRNL